ncbi:MAG: hypothetical protein QOI44_1218, partial [Actinomycetota bacterium]|nr:hypothetical protein [Actinomycetota bacterium]
MVGTYSRLSRGRRLVGLLFALPLIAGGIVAEAAPAAAAPGWAVTSSPSPLGPTNGSLRGISCPSVTSCFAVGSFHSVLAQRWNGTRWSNMLVPTPGPNGILRAVFCPTTSNCFAVGESGTNLLIERWNGTTWSIVSTANPPGATIGSLEGVSCRGAADCYAVGSAGTGSGTNTLIEHWDGTSWSVVASPNPGGSAFVSELTSVRCPLATMCVAVGFSSTP